LRQDGAEGSDDGRKVVVAGGLVGLVVILKRKELGAPWA
jgi:hypothetical protein